MAAWFQEKIILKLVDSQHQHMRLKLFVQLKREMMRQFEKLGLLCLVQKCQKWWVVDWCEMKKSIFSQSVANLFSRCRSIMLHFIWTRSFNLIKCRSWLATNSKIIFSWNPAILILRVLCHIHVVTITLISNLVTDYIQKRTGQALFFSFEYNLSPNLISK